MRTPAEERVLRLTLDKELLLVRLEGVSRDLDVSVARLDGLTDELGQIEHGLASIDDQLNAGARDSPPAN